MRGGAASGRLARVIRPPLMMLLAAAPDPTSKPSLRAGSVSEGVSKLHSNFNGVVRALPTIGLGLAVFAAFVLLGIALKWAIRRYGEKKRKNYNLILAVGRVAQGAIFIVGLLVASVIIFPDFTPASALASLGVGSVAIAFAARDILQNYLAGILLLLTEPFRLGDQVVFNNFEGTVENIQARATFIRTYDGRRAVIPNAELFTNSVLVNTAFENRRVQYDFGIGYGDSIDEAKSIILKCLEEVPAAIKEPPPEVLVYELAGSSVNLRARWWIAPPGRKDALDARDAVLQLVKERLAEAGIDLPFETQQMLIHDQTEDRDGDRAKQREGWPAGKGEVPTPRGALRGLRRASKPSEDGENPEN